MLNRHPALKRALSFLLSFALVLPASMALIGDSGTAEAKASLPYIEELKSQQGGAFNILEIAPSADEGSFGYYLKGEEPCAGFPAKAAADAGNIQKDSDGKIVPSDQRSKRQAYVQGLFTGLATAGILGGNGNYPLTKSGTYEEKYPWELTSENSSSFNNKLPLKDAGGSPYYDKGYAKNIHFDPLPADIAPGTDINAYAYVSATSYRLDTGGSYVQDVAYYTSNSADIDNLKNNLHETLYYYSLKFTKITVDVDEESGAVTAYSNFAKTEKLKGGEAIYASAADYNTPESTVVPDPGSFAYTSLHYMADGSAKLDKNHSYYIVSGVSEPKAAADETRYQGDSAYSPYQYAAVTQNDGFHEKATGETGYFSPVDGTTPTYRYVGPGNGTYKIENGSTTANILTPVVYYNTCYRNNEWFKKYVFDCDSDTDGNITETLKINFNLETVSPDKATADQIKSASLIVLSGGLKLDKDGINSSVYVSDLLKSNCDLIIDLATRNSTEAVTPLIIDSNLSTLSSTSMPCLQTLASGAGSTFGVSAAKRVKENVYLYGPGATAPQLATCSFTSAFSDTNAYSEVSERINYVNTQRAGQGAESDRLVDTKVSMATVVRHIINASQPTSTKGSVRILDIEPGNPYEGSSSNLSKETVQNKWLAGTPMKAYSPAITTWSTSEFIGKIDEIGEEFDIVYVGTNISRYTQTTQIDNLNQQIIDCTDSNMDGLVYTNIGDTVRSGGGNGYSLSGLLDRDFTTYQVYDYDTDRWGEKQEKGSFKTYSAINATSASYADQFRFSGNDLTKNAMQMLKDYAEAGHPVIVADDLLNNLQQTADSVQGHAYIRLGTWFGQELKAFDHTFTYVFTAKQGKLSIGAGADNFVESMIKYFSGSSNLETIKSQLQNPVYNWEKSANGSTWETVVSGQGISSINTAGFPDGTYFRCTIAITVPVLGNLWTINPAAKTQVAHLMGKNTVNAARVDNCSYMYEFLNAVHARSNIFSEGTFSPAYDGASDAAAAENRTKLYALVNISNPTIKLAKQPTEYAMSSSSMTTLEKQENGKYYLDYTFTVTNPTDPTPKTTTYSCNLYVDSNGDGRFTNAEKLPNVEVYCDSRPVKTLRASEAGTAAYIYTIHRPLPDDLAGIIPWKLEVVKVGSSGVHTSQTGFTHITGSGSATADHAQKSLNILQIMPSEGNNIDLNDTNYKDLFKQVERDYTVSIKQREVNKQTDWSSIKDFDMLILGFGDCYGEMTAGTATAISQFIQTGKAVLFSHDCASFYFLNDSDAKQYEGTTLIKNGFLDGWTTDHHEVTTDKLYTDDPLKLFTLYYYGYNFNTTLRDPLGLDRYGVSSTKSLDASKFGVSSQDGNTNGGFVTNNHKGSGLPSAQISALQTAGYSIAYKPNSNRKTTLPETQGLTNNILMRYYKSGTLPYGYANNDGTPFTNDVKNFFTQNAAEMNKLQTSDYVTQVNKGQITSYPFNINLSGFGGSGKALDIAETHMQYEQLNMNSDDIVVWYCLSGGGSKSLISDLSLGSTYDYMTNDVVNQYFIYTRGNVTYTGSGHSAPRTDDERKLIVNTIIAAARQGQSAPGAVFTDPAGGKTGVNTFLIPADDNGIIESSGTVTDENRRIYFKLQDTSLGSDSSRKTYNAAVTCISGATSVSLPVYYTADSGAEISLIGAPTPGQVYYVKLDDILLNQTLKGAVQKGTAMVSVKVSPSVTITQAGKAATTINGADVSIPLAKMKLFDLG